MYESFLKSVDILSSIDSYELTQVCDALTSKRFKKGEVIITENDNGDSFYIVEEGSLIATKKFEESEQEEQVMEYSKGGYFGELALIKNEPRAASIIAKVLFSFRLTASF